MKFRMVIGFTGNIRNLEILKSSGSQVFDQSVIQTLTSAVPFLPFPSPLANEREIIEVVKIAAFPNRK